MEQQLFIVDCNLNKTILAVLSNNQYIRMNW